MAVALGGRVALVTSFSGQVVINRLSRFVSLLLVACLVASCSDSVLQSPTSPLDPSAVSAAKTSGKPGGLTGGLPDAGVELKALWWNSEWKRQDVVTVKQTIDQSGGVITIPQTGLTMVFPAGAVSAPIEITVTSDDKYVAYRMEPTGTQFLKNVTVTQLLSFTQLTGRRLRNPLLAAYIADDKLSLAGKVPVLEIEPSQTIFSPSTGLPQAQVWLIKHFSRYMLASG
jgi:ZU5 domain